VRHQDSDRLELSGVCNQRAVFIHHRSNCDGSASLLIMLCTTAAGLEARNRAAPTVRFEHCGVSYREV
jgi:hypothetical protein